jgi:hypothetical protein
MAHIKITFFKYFFDRVPQTRVCGVCGGVGGCGVLSCGVTPYVQHSTDCTCCDFGHLRFNNNLVDVILY